jgi:putative SOS response-associated peptidase YedK
MCGRYTITTIDGLVAELELEVEPAVAASFEPRYNVAPTQRVPIVVQRPDMPRALEAMRWGLVPHWAKDLGIGAKLINARRETLHEKPAFRDAYSRRRCLVPSDGFFEWKREGKGAHARRRPFYYHRTDGRPFLYAGLWERWREPAGMWLTSFTIITGEPNPLLAPLHDRMPIIVEPADYERWLHPDALPPEALADVLRTPAPIGFELREVSSRVNSVANDDAACLAPPAQTTLF